MASKPEPVGLLYENHFANLHVCSSKPALVAVGTLFAATQLTKLVNLNASFCLTMISVLFCTEPPWI